MITIKIHDKQWFEKHCKVVGATGYCSHIEPKYSPWRQVVTIGWSLSSVSMGRLVGQILEAERDYGISAGRINDSRYFAGGYWIPNWAIEWVKEEQDEL